MCWFRGKTAGILLLLLTVGWATPSSGQEEKSGSSLADRISTIRDSVLGKMSPRSTSHLDSQFPAEPQVRKRNNSHKQRPGSRSRSASSSGKKASLLPKVDLGSLLPKTLLGVQEESIAAPDYMFEYPGEEEPVPSLTRVGSASSKARRSPNTRKSPSHERENELESALADLLPVEAEEEQVQNLKVESTNRDEELLNQDTIQQERIQTPEEYIDVPGKRERDSSRADPNS